jgi:hypothetical protein
LRPQQIAPRINFAQQAGSAIIQIPGEQVVAVFERQ